LNVSESRIDQCNRSNSLGSAAFSIHPNTRPTIVEADAFVNCYYGIVKFKASRCKLLVAKLCGSASTMERKITQEATGT
jgi:hypothetical protein